MKHNLELIIRSARMVATSHPTIIRRAPIGHYCLYEDSNVRLQVCDQVSIQDLGVWTPARGSQWSPVLVWSPYAPQPLQPQVFLPGDWISYLQALAACRSREWLDWRAEHWICSASRGIVAHPASGSNPLDYAALPER